MLKASKIILLTIAILAILVSSVQMAQAQDFAIYISGSDYQTVQILGSMLDNKVGQAGYNVQYNVPVNLPYIEIYVEPIESGWGHSDSNWGVSSNILYDITRVFNTSSFFNVPNAGYYSGSGNDSHYIILSFKIGKPNTTLTYFSIGVGTSEYNDDGFYASSYYKNNYNYSNFGPDFWSRYQAALNTLPNIKAEIDSTSFPTTSINNSGSNNSPYTSGPSQNQSYSVPVTTSYTPPPAPAPRSNIEFRNDENNAVSFDQLRDGDTIDIYTDVGSIIFSSGAGSIYITADQEISYLSQSHSDRNWNLPEINLEIKNNFTGKYAVVIEETRYSSRNIKKIYLNFLDKTEIYKNEEINF